METLPIRTGQRLGDDSTHLRAPGYMNILGKGAVLFASHGGAAVLSFLRNVLVARALGVEEFGVASTFAVIFAFVETATDTGLEKMIVRDKDGDEDHFLGTMHAIFLLRGLISSSLMVLLAGPFARYMGLGEIAWAYQILALAPLVRGFVHFDMYRLQRRMIFRGLISATLAAPIVGILIVLVGTMVIRDFRIVLWALIGFQTAYVAASHLTAEKPFRYRWSWEVARRGVRFGLPLFLNGLLLFAILQGDRLIIGGEIGTEVLGWFSVAWLLSSTPAFVMINTIRSVFLPRLSEGVNERGLREDFVTATMEAGCFGAITLIAGFFVLGPFVLLLVYGSDFAPALSVLQPIAAAFGMRLIVASVTTISLAGDDTPTPLVIGVTRALFLPLAYLAAISGLGAPALAWIALAGEFTSALLGGIRIVRKRNLNPLPWLTALGFTLAAAAAALSFDSFLIQPSADRYPALWMCAVLIAIAVAAPFRMRTLRLALGLVRKRR